MVVTLSGCCWSNVQREQPSRGGTATGSRRFNSGRRPAARVSRGCAWRARNDRAVGAVARAVAGAVPRPLAAVPADEAAQVCADSRDGVDRALLVPIDGELLPLHLQHARLAVREFGCGGGVGLRE